LQVRACERGEPSVISTRMKQADQAITKMIGAASDAVFRQAGSNESLQQPVCRGLWQFQQGGNVCKR